MDLIDLMDKKPYNSDDKVYTVHTVHTVHAVHTVHTVHIVHLLTRNLTMSGKWIISELNFF